MRQIIGAACVAALLLPVAAQAQSTEGRPNPAYPDGTGNDQVERLNDAQLDQNYRGPWYDRNGQPAPPPGYGAPPPPAPAGYGASPPAPAGYGAPPPAPAGYGAPPPPGGYGAPPGGYGVPPPPPPAGYGAPPPAYPSAAPPPTAGY